MKKGFFVAGVCLVCFFGSMLLPAFADNGAVDQECVEKQAAGKQGIEELTAISKLIATYLQSDTPLSSQEIEDLREQLAAGIKDSIRELAGCGGDDIVDMLKTINIFLPDVVQEQGGNLVVSLEDDICTYFIYPAIVMFFFSMSLFLTGMIDQGFLMLSMAVAFYLIYIVCP